MIYVSAVSLMPSINAVTTTVFAVACVALVHLGLFFLMAAMLSMRC